MAGVKPPDNDVLDNPLAGGSGGFTPDQHSNPGHNGEFTKSFSRKYMHYITNNMDYTGLTQKQHTVTGGVNWAEFSFDEGYHVIPYKSLKASITPREWLALGTTSNRFSIESMGYTISGFTPMQEKMTAVSGTTTVQSNFVTTPMMMHMVDSEGLTTDCLQGIDQNEDITSANADFTDMCPNTASAIDDMSLPRGIWRLGKESWNSMGSESWGQWEVSTLNDFDVTCIPPGGGAGHTWKGGNRWYALGSAYPNETEYRVGTLSSDDQIGVIESDYRTLVNKTDAGAPPNCFVKIAPYHGSEGPITITGQIMITYHCTLKFKQAPVSFWPYQNRELTGATKDSWDMAIPPAFNMNHSAGLTHWQTGYVGGKWKSGAGWGPPKASTTLTAHQFSRRTAQQDTDEEGLDFVHDTPPKLPPQPSAPKKPIRPSLSEVRARSLTSLTTPSTAYNSELKSLRKKRRLLTFSTSQLSPLRDTSESPSHGPLISLSPQLEPREENQDTVPPIDRQTTSRKRDITTYSASPRPPSTLSQRLVQLRAARSSDPRLAASIQGLERLIPPPASLEIPEPARPEGDATRHLQD